MQKPIKISKPKPGVLFVYMVWWCVKKMRDNSGHTESDVTCICGLNMMLYNTCYPLLSNTGSPESQLSIGHVYTNTEYGVTQFVIQLVFLVTVSLKS